MSKFPVYAKNTAFLLVSISTILFILIKADIIAFAFIILAEFIIGAIGMVIVYELTGNFIKDWRISVEFAKGLFRDGWPLILSGLAVMIYTRIVQVMIRDMIGDKEVGIYSAAVKISEAWYFIPTIITMSVFPSIIDAKKISKNMYNERLQKLYTE